MIREYSQKNNVISLAFLIADLPPISSRVVEYAVKKLPLTLLNYMTKKPVTELHTYLLKIQKAMDKKDPKQINLTLYQ